MGFFLSKSFGILALLAALLALLALLACRGPWLKEYPAWFVVVPAIISLLLAGLGIALLLLPTTRNSSPATTLIIHATIILVILGGIALTQFFHGDTEADRQGIKELWWMLRKMGIPVLVGAVVFAISLIGQKFKNNTKE